jgi:hypothetical protein
MAVFWDVVPCTLLEINQHSRDAYCLRNQDDDRNIPEDSHLHIRRRENLKSHKRFIICTLHKVGLLLGWVIKSRYRTRAGRLPCMRVISKAYILNKKPDRKMPLGRPRRRWTIFNWTMGCDDLDWIYLVQQRGQWRTS